MTGYEHFRAAEDLLLSCQLSPAEPGNPAATYPAREDGVDSIANALTAALIHATLAVAAALGLSPEVEQEPSP